MAIRQTFTLAKAGTNGTNGTRNGANGTNGSDGLRGADVGITVEMYEPLVVVGTDTFEELSGQLDNTSTVIFVRHATDSGQTTLDLLDTTLSIGARETQILD